MELKNTRVLIFTLVLASLVLGACGGGDSGETSAAVLTEAALIAADSLTQTAGAASPTPTATQIPPTATPTNIPPTPTATVEGAGAGEVTPTQQQQSGGSGPCLRANLEIETVPDGTQIDVGKNFTKTWRLKNTGSCNWTAGFAVIWVQGDIMDAKSVGPITEVDIPPGGYAMVSVDMQAPAEEGTFKGYWMLRSADGAVFGIGPDGKSWFWVEIKTKDPNID